MFGRFSYGFTDIIMYHGPFLRFAFKSLLKSDVLHLFYNYILYRLLAEIYKIAMLQFYKFVKLKLALIDNRIAEKQLSQQFNIYV